MPLRLTNSPPPSAMPQSGEQVRVKNRTQQICECHGPSHIHDAIVREVAGIRLLLTRFGTMLVTGTIRITVFPTTYSLSGELTAYHLATAPDRDALVREIDRRVFLLRDTFGPYIERIELVCEQVYNAEADPTGARTGLSFGELSLHEYAQLRELSLAEYAQLAISQGVKCSKCERPAQVEDIQHYGPHPEGWRLKGYATKRWLFINCPACHHQTSFAKLKIARPVP